MCVSNIKPVSDLRNYNDILKASQIESSALLAHLEEGEKSAREEGWTSPEDIEEALGL
jgi:hypothetical protein